MILSPLPTMFPLFPYVRLTTYRRDLKCSSEEWKIQPMWTHWDDLGKFNWNVFAHENDFVFKFCFDFVLVFSESPYGSGGYRSTMTDIITLIILSLSVLVKFGSALAACSTLAIDSNEIYKTWMQNITCENVTLVRSFNNVWNVVLVKLHLGFVWQRPRNTCNNFVTCI